MKKRVLGAFLLGIAAAGALGTTTVLADATDNQSATTTGNVSFEAGTLSLTGVQDSVSFGSANVGDVYTNGLNDTATSQLTATVNDFLGTDGTWTLKLSQNGWVAGDNGSQSGANALNAGTLTTTDATGNKNSTLSTDGLTYATGSEGTTVTDSRDLNLSLAKGTTVKTGSYTNTLNWKLSDDASADQS